MVERVDVIRIMVNPRIERGLCEWVKAGKPAGLGTRFTAKAEFFDKTTVITAVVLNDDTPNDEIARQLADKINDFDRTHPPMTG